MYLSRLSVDPAAARDAAFWREVTSPYGAHQAIWRLFRRHPQQTRDFLFRQEIATVRGLDRVHFFVLSEQPPVAEERGHWSVETKPFAPRLRPGDRLGFQLRANATIRRKVEGRDQGPRDDVVMRARRRAQDAGQPFDQERAVQEEGHRWLARRAAAAGFELARGAATLMGEDGILTTDAAATTLRVDGYRRHTIRRGERNVQFRTLDFEGVLTVTEPERFISAVGRGFGAEKAFGCGLMLLRRA